MTSINARLYLAVSYTSMFIGSLAIIGWYFQIDELISLYPSLPTMKFNTGIGFILVGGILILNHYEKKIPLNISCLGLFALGTVSAIERVFQLDIGFSQLFVTDQISPVDPNGIMSLATATSFMTLAIAIYLSNHHHANYRSIGQIAFHYVSLTAYLSLMGYVYGISNEGRLGFISSMSVPTTLLFLMLSAVGTLKNPTTGLTGLLLGRMPGNILARRMFTVVALSVLVIGLITTQTMRYDQISAESAITLFGILVFAIYTGTITSNAIQLNLMYQRQLEAENKLQDVNKMLEKKVEERTQSAKDALDLLTETNRIARIGGWELDLQNDRLTWTSVTRQIHEAPIGYKPQLESAIEFYPEGEHRNNITKAINNAISLGLSWDLELQIISAQGNRKWVRANGSPTFDGGKCVRINGTFQDIDLRKKAEIAVHDERLFLQTIIDHIPANIYVKDLEDNIILANESLLSFLGKNSDDVLGHQESFILPKDYVSSFPKKELEQVQNDEKGLLSKEISILNEQNSLQWFLKSKVPLRDYENKISGLLDVSLDITQRKMNEKKLNKIAVLTAKNKEMEQFAYITSHDLKEPLLTIKNYAALMLMTAAPELSEDNLKYLKTVNKGAERMESLINALLEYSRLSKPEPLSPVNVNDTLKDVISGLEVSIQKSGTKITYDTLPTLEAYPHILELLFQNLISNAIKFVKPSFNPEIFISARSLPDSGWEFAVKDNGIGISKENFDKIFTIFKRLHHKSDYPGTGIGLAHCRKIVEIHNGKIWVESIEGVGSTFFFTIHT